MVAMIILKNADTIDGDNDDDDNDDEGKYDNSLMVAWRIGSTWRSVPGLVRVARIKIPSEARNKHWLCMYVSY